jgi:invasion protein IalB
MHRFLGAPLAPVLDHSAAARKGGRLCFLLAPCSGPQFFGARTVGLRFAAMAVCAVALTMGCLPAAQAKEGAATPSATPGATAPALGPRVAASAAPGQPKAADSSERLFGSWSLICSKHKPPRCGLTQAVATDPAGKQVVLGAAVHPVPELGKLRLEFRVSSAADPKAGIGMKFQDGPEYRLPMSGCTAQYCTASGVLDGGIREALENGKAVQMAFMMPGPKQALVPLALGGFKEGVAALEKASKGAAVKR